MDILHPYQERYKSISSLLSKKEMERYYESSLTNCICLCDSSHCNVILCV
uniref:Uncharacterized protein n=1 Tax=Anguilla anguilla TaxID=7936 RepID=A0A0E9X0R6_ANGAN